MDVGGLPGNFKRFLVLTITQALRMLQEQIQLEIQHYPASLNLLQEKQGGAEA